MTDRKYPILDRINSPDDLKKLPQSDMEPLCGELRAFLVENVMKTGGHLASNLGVVELTVAIHRVFDAPRDSIIWDVGHQSYVHKILTGRKDRFAGLRTPGGLSGFTKRDESIYDPFGAGHSSTSLSAAIGIARAKALSGDNSYTVAVVGDGAFTGGLIHEALNNSDKSLRLIVILNENEMSISKNIGSFAKHLQKVRTSGGYHRTKRATRNILYRIPLVGKPVFGAMKRAKQALKNAMYHTNYFEDMGLYYIGPVDGHNTSELERMLGEAKLAGQSAIVHVKTVKGRGFAPAETDPGRYHGILPGDVLPGHNFSAEMGDILCDIAASDEKAVAITAAMSDGCGLCRFASLYPDRFFDVGIAEEHALVFAAGLAAAGMHPFFAVYSTFLQRGYDNILHDIALQHLPVRVCIDRANLAERDGPTHHGIFDVAFLSTIPEITLYAPFDYPSLLECMTAPAEDPVFIRYPSGQEDRSLRDRFVYRSDGVRSDFDPDGVDLPNALIITYGRIVSQAIAAADALRAEGIACGIVLVEKLKPIVPAVDFIKKQAQKNDCPLLFLEEGVLNGSFSMNVHCELTVSGAIGGRQCRILAIRDSFAPSEAGKTAYESCGISAEDCKKAIRDMLGKQNGNY